MVVESGTYYWPLPGQVLVRRLHRARSFVWFILDLKLAPDARAHSSIFVQIVGCVRLCCTKGLTNLAAVSLWLLDERCLLYLLLYFAFHFCQTHFSCLQFCIWHTHIKQNLCSSCETLYLHSWHIALFVSKTFMLAGLPTYYRNTFSFIFILPFLPFIVLFFLFVSSVFLVSVLFSWFLLIN